MAENKEDGGAGPAEKKPKSLWLFAFGAVTLFVFMRLAVLASGTSQLAFDERLLRAMRSTGDLSIPAGPPWLAYAARDITALGGITVLGLATLLTVFYLLLARRPRVAALVLLSIAGGWLISTLLKIGIARPRPDIIPHLVEVHDFSFPSGHAMLSAVTWLTLGALAGAVQKERNIRTFLMVSAIALTLIIGASRVFLGVHYPSDVLGGWCAAAIWVIVCRLMASRIIGKRRDGL